MIRQIRLHDGHEIVHLPDLGTLDARLDELVRGAVADDTPRSAALTAIEAELRLDITSTTIVLTLHDRRRPAALTYAPMAHVEARAYIRSYAETGNLPPELRQTP